MQNETKLCAKMETVALIVLSTSNNEKEDGRISFLS
jgi:hypothetical protein